MQFLQQMFINNVFDYLRYELNTFLEGEDGGVVVRTDAL